MEEYQRVRDALDCSSDRFQEANEYYVRMNEENPNNLIIELCSVLNNHNIPLKEREQLLPVITSVIPRNIFEYYQAKKLMDKEILLESSSILTQFFNQEKRIRDLAASYYAKLRNMIEEEDASKLCDLFDIILSENATIKEIEASTIAIKDILRINISVLGENELPIVQFLEKMNSLELTEDIAKSLLGIIPDVVPNESSDEIIHMAFELFFKSSMKTVPECLDTPLFCDHVEAILDTADVVFSSVVDVVKENPDKFQLIQLLLIKNDEILLCRGYEEDILNLIIEVIHFIKNETDKESQKQTIAEIIDKLRELNSPEFYLELSNELSKSDDPIDHFTSIVLFYAAVDYFTRNLINRYLTEEEKDLKYNVASNVNNVATCALQSDDPDVICLGISLIENCYYLFDEVEKSPEIVEQVISFTECEDQHVSAYALQVVSGFIKFARPDDVVAFFDKLLNEVQEEDNDDEKINELMQSMSEIVNFIEPADAVERLPTLIGFYQEVIENPDAIYFSSTVGLLCALYVKAGAEAHAIADDMIEAAQSLLETDNDNVGMEIISSVLKNSEELDSTLLESIAEHIIQRMETAEGSEEIKTAMQVASEIIRFIDEEEYLKKLIEHVIVFIKEGDQNLLRIISYYAIVIFALIGEKIPDILEEHLDVIMMLKSPKMEDRHTIAIMKLIRFIMNHSDDEENLWSWKAYSSYPPIDGYMNEEYAHLFLEIYGMGPKVQVFFNTDLFQNCLTVEEFKSLEELVEKQKFI